MTVRMLINATVAEELRIAIVEDGELVDLDVESIEGSSIRGNIYKGVVHNVEGSLAAAFINYGDHKQGFLPFNEIDPSSYYRKWDKKEPPKITDVIKRGQEVVVQAAKDPVGEKGAALTTYLSIPGRYAVLMPGSDARGISRKVEGDTARRKIKAMAEKIEVPKDCGFIVRTAGLAQGRTAIQKDLDRIAEVYEKIDKAAKIARAPSILYSEPDLIVRTLRDLFNEDIDEVLIDNREEYEAAKEYFEELMPQYVDRIQHYQNPIPIFTYHHVEEQVEATFDRVVPLPGGGSIVIDETEAMTAIDVNSGKMTSESGHEETVYKTNFEAAFVIAQQIRLRDVGGILVIDFIDMEMSRNKRAVEKAFKDAVEDDKARVKVSRILSNGLCIVTRQRIRGGIKKTVRQRCPACDGTGWVRSPESHSLSLLKRIEARLAQGEVEEVRVSTHKMTAEYILNRKRAELLGLERQYRCRILIAVKLELDKGTDEVKFLSKGELLQEITGKLPPREKRKKLSERKRKRKKKTKGADERTSEAPRPRKEREVEEEPSVEGRPTFTGRPPKELLEKIRAEAEARRAARAARLNAGPADAPTSDRPAPDPERPSSEPEPIASESNPNDAPVEAAAEVSADYDGDEQTPSGKPKPRTRKARATKARTSKARTSKAKTASAEDSTDEPAAPAEAEGGEERASGGGLLRRLLGGSDAAAAREQESDG